MRRRVALPVPVLSVLALLGALPVAAQDAATQAVAAKASPEVIAPADIPLQADADERHAGDVIRRSRFPVAGIELEASLDKLDAAVREESELLGREDLQLLSVTRLQGMERHWRFYAGQLERWRRGFGQATRQYTQDAAKLAGLRATWEATRAASAATGMAPALADRIQGVLQQITLAEQAVSVPIDRQVRLSRRANRVETRILDGRKDISAAIAYNDSRLWRIDSPPLWELLREPRPAGGSLESVKRAMAVESRFLDQYRAANADFHQRRDVVALLLLPLLLWLSFRSRKVTSDDPGIQSATQVLRRPLSSWLILLGVGVLVLEPDAPLLLHQLALLLLLVPVLRLLPPAVYELLGPWPYLATVLYLLERVGYLLVAHPLLYRMYLLGLTLLTVALLAWLLWRRRPRSASAELPRSQKVLRSAAWAVIAALLGSAVANLVGNVSLAEMLTVGIVDTGYIGLVLYAGVTVCASVLRLLLARRVIARFRIVTQHAGPLLHSFTRLLQFGALAAWVVVALVEFRVYRPVRDVVAGILTHELRFGEISLTLGGVLLFAFSVWLAFWAAKTVRLILQDEVLPKMSLPRGVGNSITSLTYYAMVILGLFVALAAAGFEVSQLAIVVGALGVGIGFGLQNVVNNFVSGLILMFERPIQPGDVVEVGGTSGKVREIGMRATTLSTFEGADVVVPNGVLLNEKLINWTLSDMDRRIDVNVGVAYGTDPRRVLELLMEVTRSTPGITGDPEPTVLFVGFGASSLDFGIRAWTNEFGEWVKIRSELTVRVHDALRAAGIEIPFPQQDVHLRSVAPAAGVALASLGPPTGPRPGG